MLFKVSDRLTGSDILVVSGDLIMEPEGLRGLTDMHRLKRSHFVYKLIKKLLLMWGQKFLQGSFDLLAWTKSVYGGHSCSRFKIHKVQEGERPDRTLW